MADVLFEGVFNLNQALQQFEQFAQAVERRLAGLKTTVATTAGGGTDAAADAARKKEIAAEKAHLNNLNNMRNQEGKRLAKELEDRNNAMRNAEGKRRKKELDDEEKAIKDSNDRKEREAKLHADRMNTLRNQEGRRVAKELNDQEAAMNKVEKGFLNIILKSYALHQVGQLLNQAVTQPLANFARGVLDITVRFDTLEQLLAQRGKKSIDEIAKSMESVGKVALARNFDLEQSVTLYSRLFEATRGAIDDKLFETIGKGLSNVMSTIEPSERRSFFGQLQDVLGGGNVANLDRTLSLAPALKTVFDEIKRGAKGALTEQQAMIMAFEQMAKMPALNDLETNLKNIGVRMQLIQIRIGKVYKDELLALTNFLEQRVFPIINQIVTRFEQLPEAIQNTIAIFAGLTAAIAPLVGMLGTIELLFPNFLSGTLAAQKFVAILPRLVALLNPVTAAIAAIVALMGVLIAYNVGGSGTAFDGLINTLQNNLLTVLKDIYTIAMSLYGIVEGLYNLLAKIDVLRALVISLGHLLALLINIVNVLMVIQQPLHYLAVTLQLISDLLNGNFELGFDRFRLAQMKMARQLYDSMPFLYKFTDWMLSFGGGGSSQSKMNEEIEKLEQNVKDLTSTVDKEALDAFEKYVNQVNQVGAAYQQAASNASNLTKQIREQNEALNATALAQIATKSQVYFDSQQKLREFMRDQRREQLEGLDMTTASGRAEASRRAAGLEDEARADADAGKRQRVAQAIAKSMTEKANDLLKEINKEVQKNEVALDPEMKEIYSRLAGRLQAAATQPDKLSTSVVESIFRTSREEAATLGNYNLALPLTNRIEGLRLQINQQAKAESDLITEYSAFWYEKMNNAKRLRQLIQQGQDLEEQVKIDEQYRKDSDEFDKRTADAELAIKEALEHARVISDYSGAVKVVADKEAELLQIEADRLAREKSYIIESGGGKEQQAVLDKQTLDAEAASGKRADKIRADASASRLALQRRFIKTEEENLKTLKELQELLTENANTRIDLLVKLIGLTGDEARYGAELEKVTAERNKYLGKTAAQNLIPAIEGAITAVGGIPNLGGGDDADAIGGLRYALQTLKTAATEFLTPADIDEMLKNTVSIPEVLRRLMQSVLGEGSTQPVEVKLAVQNAINAIDTLIKGAKDARKLLEEQIPASIKLKEARLLNLERQNDLNDGIQRELDLTREIVSLRRQRGIGQGVLDILSGGRLSDYEMEKEMIRQKIEGAKLELEMAVLRLEIEMEILTLKWRADKVDEAKIAAMRDHYGRLIQMTKEEGALRGKLLQEQLDSASYLQGGLGDMIFQGLALGLKKLFGAFSKDKVTVQGDVDFGGAGGTALPDFGDDPNKKKDVFGDIFNPKEIDATGKAVDILDSKYKKIGATAGTVAKAILAMNDLSMKSIRNAIAAALDAFAEEALVQAIRFAAIALSALVFGDYATAAKAGIAAAAWGGVAVAAKVGAALIGTGDGDSAANSQSSQSAQAGTTPAATEAQILKQQALSITILLDIRTDDSVVIKKHVKALNQNTELTNLTMNQQEGWAFSPTP